MEDLTEKLREMGFDITTIIEGRSNQKVLDAWYKFPENQDVVLPEWTKEDIVKFSNYVYNLLTKGKSSE